MFGKLKQHKTKIGFSFLLLIILIVLAIGSYFAYRNYQLTKQIDVLKNQTTPVDQAEAKRQADQLKKEVSTYFLLPSEDPTIATVLDATTLKNNPFFKNAMNGDKVLVFPQAQKAIIYRPNDHKVIEVGYFNPNETQPPQTGLEQQASQVKVGLRAAGSTQQDVQAVEKNITTNFPESVVIERSISKKTDLKSSIVVDVTGKNEKEVQNMSAKLGLTISKLPDGEATTAADILIFVARQL